MNFEVKEVVCDYGIFADGKLIPRLILNSKANANEIVRILEVDDRHERFDDQAIKKSYLHFKDMPVKKGMKTRIVNVYSLNGSESIGEISWFPHWRRYVFFPAEGTLYDPDCLKELAEKVKEMTQSHKENRDQEKITNTLLNHHLEKQS